MKKTILLLITASLMCSMTACIEEIQNVNRQESVELITETITARLSEGDTKVTITADASSNFSWTATTDKIAVHTTHGYYTSEGASSSGANTSFSVTYAGSRTAFAIYPSTIVAPEAEYYGQPGSGLTVTLPSSYALADIQDTKTLCPMIADNTESTWSFYQLCALFRLTVNSIPADATSLTIDFHSHQVCGEFTVANPVIPGSSTIATAATPDGTNDAITITFPAGTTSATFNLPLPTGDYTDVSITTNSPTTKVASVRHISRTEGKYTAQRAHGKQLTTTLVSFQIGADEYAVFSPGNLRCTLTSYTAPVGTGVWSFAPTQYATINKYYPDGEREISFTVGSVIDLFGWQGSESVEEPHYGICTSDDYNYYGNNSNPSYLKIDWGALIIDNYVANDWYTFSADEFSYLLDTRPLASSKYGKADVAGVKGVIILPDSFIDPMTNGGSESFVQFEESQPFNVNQYAQGANWNAMEDAGAIFLPAAGLRAKTSVAFIFDNTGRYWTRTGSITVSKSFGVNNCNMIWEDKWYGCSVRLIRAL